MTLDTQIALEEKIKELIESNHFGRTFTVTVNNGLIKVFDTDLSNWNDSIDEAYENGRSDGYRERFEEEK